MLSGTFKFFMAEFIKISMFTSWSCDVFSKGFSSAKNLRPYFLLVSLRFMVVFKLPVYLYLYLVSGAESGVEIKP